MSGNMSFSESFQQELEQAKKKKALQIMANVDECQAILRKIKGKAADVRTQKKLLEQLSADTETCWRGLSGDALREKLSQMIAQQDKIAKELEENANEMIRMLQQLEDEDERLAAAIRGSSGGGRRA